MAQQRPPRHPLRTFALASALLGGPALGWFGLRR